MIISLFYVTMFVLNAKLCSIYALILEGFGGLNFGFFISVFGEFLLKKSGLIFKSPVATLHCRPPEAYAVCSVRINVQCQFYPFSSAIM